LLRRVVVRAAVVKDAPQAAERARERPPGAARQAPDVARASGASVTRQQRPAAAPERSPVGRSALR